MSSALPTYPPAAPLATAAPGAQNAPGDSRVGPPTAHDLRDDRGDVEFLEEDLLVEDVSIDGMCGVY
jgi:mycofactocin precursor